MSGLGELTAIDPEPRTRRPLPWLGAGAVLGAAVTAALVLVVARLVAPEPPPAAQPAPRFVSEAVEAGVDHVYDGDFTFFVGGGVAVLDCDQDGAPDLYLAGGSNPAGLYRNAGAVGGPLAFDRVADPATDLEAVTGAYPLDIDSDGITDLAVLRVGEDVLLRGTGDCRFERANERWGFEGGDAWTVAFSATWEESATWPTLVFGNYLDMGEGRPRTCDDHALVRPGGDGFSPPMSLGPGWCTLSILFSDWGRNGRMDLRMTNDRHYYRDGQEQLWRMEPGRTPTAFTAEDGWEPLQIWGMGIASHDLTGDGRPEVFLTSQGDNKLQTLAGDGGAPGYRDIALDRGVTAHRPYTGGDPLPSTAWHAEFADVNNDGYSDLYIAKGNVEAMPEFADRDPANLLLGQTDGTFVEGAEAAGIVGFERGRGAALVDLNLDGMLDLVEVNRRSGVELWRNVGWGEPDDPTPTGRWLAVRLTQNGANRDGVGAWIEVRRGDRVSTDEVTVGGGHAGGQLGWVHFGLGDEETAQIRVTWPDGEVGDWEDVEADGFYLVGRGSVTRWSGGD